MLLMVQGMALETVVSVKEAVSPSSRLAIAPYTDTEQIDLEQHGVMEMANDQDSPARSSPHANSHWASYACACS